MENEPKEHNARALGIVEPSSTSKFPATPSELERSVRRIAPLEDVFNACEPRCKGGQKAIQGLLVREGIPVRRLVCEEFSEPLEDLNVVRRLVRGDDYRGA